jgi:hypothetical protein
MCAYRLRIRRPGYLERKAARPSAVSASTSTGRTAAGSRARYRIGQSVRSSATEAKRLLAGDDEWLHLKEIEQGQQRMAAAVAA